VAVRSVNAMESRRLREFGILIVGCLGAWLVCSRTGDFGIASSRQPDLALMKLDGNGQSVVDMLRNVSIAQASLQQQLSDVQYRLRKRDLEELITPIDWKPCWKDKMCMHSVPCEFEGPGLVCGLERDTQKQIVETLSVNSTVLEVGSRFGTVSCTISKRQENSGLRLSMEPDKNAFKFLGENTARNRCGGMIVNGVVSHTNASLNSWEYATAAAHDVNGDIQGYLPAQLEQMLGQHVGHAVTFDSLFLDCEGCAFEFIKEHADFMKRTALRKVYLEADDALPLKYDESGNAWRRYETEFIPLMCSYGLDVEEDIINTTCCPAIHHLVFSRSGKCAAAYARR